jgi:hypothetical protein
MLVAVEVELNLHQVVLVVQAAVEMDQLVLEVPLLQILVVAVAVAVLMEVVMLVLEAVQEL